MAEADKLALVSLGRRALDGPGPSFRGVFGARRLVALALALSASVSVASSLGRSRAFFAPALLFPAGVAGSRAPPPTPGDTAPPDAPRDASSPARPRSPEPEPETPRRGTRSWGAP